MVPLAMLLLFLQSPVQLDPAVGAYATRLCRKLSPSADVRLIVDSGIRAEILPGGHVDLSTGLLARAQNEAELAGVIAHQIAHIDAATACIRFVHIGRMNTEHSYDRENERQADQTAIRILTKAGYDPNAMLAFFSKYRREATDLPHSYSAEDLIIEKLQIEATDHPLKNPILNTPEFEQVHSLIDKSLR